tara:strand:+ start:28506 stop:28877 length:372 start_codon:yes stop_codon:yes gene_type:complete
MCVSNSSNFQESRANKTATRIKKDIRYYNLIQETEMSGDWCTTDGARRLKDKIEAYWRERGFDVDIDLVEAGFIAAMRSGRTDVRSNMINGMPVRGERKSDDTARMARSMSKHSGESNFSWAS